MVILLATSGKVEGIVTYCYQLSRNTRGHVKYYINILYYVMYVAFFMYV